MTIFLADILTTIERALRLPFECYAARFPIHEISTNGVDWKNNFRLNKEVRNSDCVHCVDARSKLDRALIIRICKQGLTRCHAMTLPIYLAYRRVELVFSDEPLVHKSSRKEDRHSKSNESKKQYGEHSEQQLKFSEFRD